MKRKVITILTILAVIIAGFLIWRKPLQVPQTNSPGNNEEQTLSDGTIRFAYPPGFGLAVSKEQVLVASYIPPCEEGFDYCLYYNGDEFKGTNFESAGIRIQKRPDLNTENSCLNTPPNGFDGKNPSGTLGADDYSASIFSKIGDAALGHYASGEMYRIFTDSKCYEITTRIGETQFANYEPGTIKKFEEADRDKVYQKLNSFFDNLILVKSGQKIRLPVSED